MDLGFWKRFFKNKTQDYCHILHTLRLKRFQCTVFSAKIVTQSVMSTFDMSLTRYFLFVVGRPSCTEMGSVFLFLHVWSFYSKVRISQTKFDLFLLDLLWFGVMFIYIHVKCTVKVMPIKIENIKISLFLIQLDLSSQWKQNCAIIV